MLNSFVYTPEQFEVKDVSDTHKIFTYNGYIFLLDYNKETDEWTGKVYEHINSEKTKGINTPYSLVTALIRYVDYDGAYCPNYVSEITKTNFEITEHGLDY